MSPQQVVASVQQKQWSIVEAPSGIGPDAGPALLPLLNDKDAEIRELTVWSLDIAGGKSGKDGLFRALQDRTATVRAAAARFLHHHATAADLPLIEKELATNKDEYVREQMALVAGKIGGPQDIPAVGGPKGREKDEHTRHAIDLALARLGDLGSREAYLQALLNDDPLTRSSLIADLPYIHDPKLAPRVAPLLDDVRPGKNVGPSHGPYFIRVCDVTINALDELLVHPFPFTVDPGRRYTPAEITQAKAVLSRL